MLRLCRSSAASAALESAALSDLCRAFSALAGFPSVLQHPCSPSKAQDEHQPDDGRRSGSSSCTDLCPAVPAGAAQQHVNDRHGQFRLHSSVVSAALAGFQGSRPHQQHELHARGSATRTSGYRGKKALPPSRAARKMEERGMAAPRSADAPAQAAAEGEEPGKEVAVTEASEAPPSDLQARLLGPAAPCCSTQHASVKRCCADWEKSSPVLCS
jgi:hypothetical protein